MRVLAEDIPPGQKILRYVGAFFDYLAEHPSHREMVQREMLARGSQMQRIVKLYMKPIYEELVKVLRAGIADGIFRPVDPLQFLPSMVAVIVHYFGSAPLLKVMTAGRSSQSGATCRPAAAVLDFISAAFIPTYCPTVGRRAFVNARNRFFILLALFF